MLSGARARRTSHRLWSCLNAPCGAGCFLTTVGSRSSSRPAGLNAPSGPGCFLTQARHGSIRGRRSLNVPCGAGCFLTRTSGTPPSLSSRLNAPCGAGCFLTPASGSGVVAPLPEAGAPPAPQAPRGAGQHCPYLTTFWRPDAKRHRRPSRAASHQLPTTSSQKVDAPACDCGHNLLWWRWSRALDSASRALPPPSRLVAQLVKEMRMGCKSRQ